MQTTEPIVFPCDTPGWLDLKHKLTEAKTIASASSRELVDYVQRVTTIGTGSSGEDEAAERRPKSVLVDLIYCVDSALTAEEQDAYLIRILLHIIDRAVAIESHCSSENILACRQQRGGDCTISRKLVASVMACSFLGLFPKSNTLSINFDDLFSNMPRKEAEKRWIFRLDLVASRVLYDVTPNGRLFHAFAAATEKARPPIVQSRVCGTAGAEVEDDRSDVRLLWLRTEMQYFDWLSSPGTVPDGCITFSRQIVKDSVPGDELFSNQLCSVEALVTAAMLPTNTSHLLQDTASFPELVVSCVLTGRRLDTNEYLTVDSLSLFYCVAGGADDETRRCEDVEAHLCLSPVFQLPQPALTCASATVSSEECQSSETSGIVEMTVIRMSSVLKQLLWSRLGHKTDASHKNDVVSDKHSSHGAVAGHDPKHSSASRSHAKNWQQRSSEGTGSFNQSLSHGISLELESSSSSSSGMPSDEAGVLLGAAGGRRRSSLLQGAGASSRRGSALHGQLSVTSESSSSSERRRSSCLSDVSVRSGSSKRSSTGDFSAELLEEYFDNSLTHRSIQTAVIEEEVAAEAAASPCDVAAVCDRPDELRLSGMSGGQNLLEHFVDNLINEAAQQSKVEIERHLVQSEAGGDLADTHTDTRPPESVSGNAQSLETYAIQLADDVITDALADVAGRDLQRTRSGDDLRPLRHRAFRRQVTEPSPDPHRQHRCGRWERQQTVSGFRDSMLSDFDNKLISSTVSSNAAAATASVLPLTEYHGHRRRSRRASEPADISRKHLTAPSTASEHDRDIINGWFLASNSLLGHSTVENKLSKLSQGIVVNAFVDIFSSASIKRRQSRSPKSTPPTATAVPSVISWYADQLTGTMFQAAHEELRTSAGHGDTLQDNLQSVAADFARSIMADVLAGRSASPGIPDAVAAIVPSGDGSDDDRQLFTAVCQWIAASLAHLPRLQLCFHNHTQRSQMESVIAFATENHLTAGALMSKLVEWSRQTHSHSANCSGLLEFITGRH